MTRAEVNTQLARAKALGINFPDEEFIKNLHTVLDANRDADPRARARALGWAARNTGRPSEGEHLADEANKRGEQPDPDGPEFGA